MACVVKRVYGKDRLPRALAHEALEIGQLVFMNADGEWELADGNAAGEFPAVGVVTRAVATANITTVYPEVCRAAIIGGYTGMTLGAKYYLSATAGAIGAANTALTTSGECIQTVAYAHSATELQFKIGSEYNLNLA